MAALSPAHFLLWTKLTTASSTPSVTPSEGTNQRTTVGVSSSTYPKHQSYLSVPPPLFFWTLSQHMYLCVCVRVCVFVCCMHAPSQPFVSGVLLSWLAPCLYHFLCFCHSQSQHRSIPLPSPHSFLPLHSPSPRCLDEGYELKESRNRHREYRL